MTSKRKVYSCSLAALFGELPRETRLVIMCQSILESNIIIKGY